MSLNIRVHHLRLLTLDVLIFCEKIWSWVRIFYQFSTLRWHRKFNCFPMEDKDLPTYHSQIHGCWWTGDIRSHFIIGLGIDVIYLEYSGFSTIGGKWGHIKQLVTVSVVSVWLPPAIMCTLGKHGSHNVIRNMPCEAGVKVINCDEDEMYTSCYSLP